MVGEACLPSNAYYPQTPDYTLCSGVHVCWSEHSDSSFVYGFMILDYGFGTMTATTYKYKKRTRASPRRFLIYLGFTALLRIFHLYRANRSSKVGENRRTRGKTTGPSVIRIGFLTYDPSKARTTAVRNLMD